MKRQKMTGISMKSSYDAIQVHGGSGFMLEYKCQRIYRDARITSIYEGTTQLQVVAAIRYITNGTYLNIMKEMLEDEVSAELQPLKERTAAMVAKYETVLAGIAGESQEKQDFIARHLYEMTGDIIMSLLILRDASVRADLFARSAHVYVRLAEADFAKHEAFIATVKEEDLENYRAE